VLIKNNIWYSSVEVWNGFATSFMMPLMFAISGASLFYAIGKGGFGKFVKDKVQRLLIPLLDMLSSRQLTNQADYVVLSMDIPFKTLNGAKINSTTSALFYGLKDDSGPNWRDAKP
jgi:hypothetical protein